LQLDSKLATIWYQRDAVDERSESLVAMDEQCVVNVLRRLPHVKLQLLIGL
jgi:hypothetical protein